jgi:hypothetical protein
MACRFGLQKVGRLGSKPLDSGICYGGKAIMIDWNSEKHTACIYSQLKNLFIVRSRGHDDLASAIHSRIIA